MALEKTMPAVRTARPLRFLSEREKPGQFDVWASVVLLVHLMGAGVKVCANPQCGGRFTPSSNRQRFCTPLCRFLLKASTDARRYWNSHRRERSAWPGRVAYGATPCARCGETIEPGDPWDLDHLADGSRRPSHASCNRAAPMLEAPELDANGDPVDARWTRDMYGRWERRSRVW